MERDYDVILIGSGMGALTVASLMAQLRDKRVLVIERHSRPGGYTHDFRRGKFLFDTGLHYLGQMEKGSRGRRLLDLITGGGDRVGEHAGSVREVRLSGNEFRRALGACALHRGPGGALPGRSRRHQEVFQGRPAGRGRYPDSTWPGLTPPGWA